MSRKTLNDILLQALEGLAEQDFKKCRLKLSEFDFDDKPSIPWCKLEKAERTDVLELLEENYGQERAVDIAIQLFTVLSLKDSAMKLKQKKETALGSQQTSERPANAYRVKYREHIKNKYTTIKDTNARLGENVNLNNRYTKLIIGHIYQQKTQREREITVLGRRHAEIMTERTSPITIGNLFESHRKGPSPQIVVLQGAAGIGKTLTARKIMLDWANEELYQNRFDYVFYINDRKINCVREQGSVEDLILKNCPDQNAPTEEILMNPEKLLFIIDGFDESSSNLCSDPCEKQPMEIMLGSLFRKVVLLRSYLIITTRPTALEKLEQCLEDQHYAYAEILGFSENGRKEYFYKFFGNEEQARRAFNFVEDNEMLFTMCFIPLVCWIICTVLKQQMVAGEDLARTSITITGVYKNYLFRLLQDHSSNSKQQVQGNLKGLCSLAADGIWRQKILFEEEDVKKHGLDQSDSLFLNENMFHKGIGCERVYSFIHLSFQEFFAALFYLLEKEETVEDSETAIQPVDKLFEKCKKSRNYFMLTVQFLFGLLNKKRLEDLEKNISCKFSPKIKNNLLTWVKEKPFLSLFSYDQKVSPDEDMMIFYLDYFYCLYEIQETEFVQSAMNHFTELKFTDHTFTKMDQIVLQFCIKNCCKLESLWLENCTFLTEDLKEDSPGPSKRPRWAEHQHETHHSPIYLLCQALEDPNCNLKKLNLGGCHLTGACCGDLSAVLRTRQRLTELELRDNELGDSGVHLLCEGLKHPNCKLQKLNLQGCSITEVGCGDLAAVLGISQTVTEMELEDAFLTDAGVRLLCGAQKEPYSNLQRLRLHSCASCEEKCRNRPSAPSTRQTLTFLDLGGNRLGHSGVQLLCEGLKHPNCKLQTLRLGNVYLTPEMQAELDAVKKIKPGLNIEL